MSARGTLCYMMTGTLMAVPFDVQSRQVTGAPVALIEGVMQGLNALSGADETERDSSRCPPPGPCSTPPGASVRFARVRWYGSIEQALRSP